MHLIIPLFRSLYIDEMRRMHNNRYIHITNGLIDRNRASTEARERGKWRAHASYDSSMAKFS